jgi:hypothetical protein
MEVITKEKKKENLMLAEVENKNLTTHEDFFTLGVSHGFWRLKPYQVTNLGAQWLEVYELYILYVIYYIL